MKKEKKTLMKIAAVMFAALMLLGIESKWRMIGVPETYAANSGEFLSSVDIGDTITMTADNTDVIFCLYTDSAQRLIDDFTGDGYPATGGNQLERYSGLNTGDTVSAPGSVAGRTVIGWELCDVKTAGDSTMITYYARVKTNIYFYPSGYLADGDIVDFSEEISLDYEPLHETIEGNLSTGSNLSEITMKGANAFSYDGYKLVGWRNDDSDSLSYIPVGESEIIARGAGNNIIYEAVWERDKIIEVTYRPGAGSGSNINTTVEWSYETGGDFKSIPLISSADFTRPGYELIGWSLVTDDSPGGNMYYELGSACSIGANKEGPLVFDAVWGRIPEVDVTVLYRPGDGTGDPVTKTMTLDIDEEDGSATLTLLDKADFRKSGYTLNGWTDGSTTYALGAGYDFNVGADELSKEFAFDAVWKEKKTGEIDIDVKSSYYLGQKFDYDTKKNSDGDVTIEYKKRGDKDSNYSKSYPTEPGKYTVRATLDETDEYTSADDEDNFEIICLDTPEGAYSYQEVKNSDGTVIDLNIVAADGYSVSKSQKEGFSSSVRYTEAKSTGVYVRRDKDKAVTAKNELKTYTATDDPKIIPPDKVLYGTKYTVEVSAYSPAARTVTYKKADEPDSAYSSVLPTAQGKYKIRLTAPATEFYKAIDITADLSIDFMEAPGEKVTVKGSTGNKGWYISDVTLLAPEGYKISTGLTGEFKYSIEYDSGIDKIYYERELDGAISDGVPFDSDFRIDTLKPTATYATTYGPKIPEAGEQIELFEDSVSFTIKDKNLDTVLVNADSYPASNGECTVRLEAVDEAEAKTIVATDMAGNSLTFTIVLSPAWMFTKTIPLGRMVSLRANTCYNLESGKWKVDGDDTVYYGGNSFYVKNQGDYKFEKQETE